MMQPLVVDFTDDETAILTWDQFSFGSAFLVSPVLAPGVTTRKVYLPSASNWFDFWTGKKYEGGSYVDSDTPLSSLPLFVKAGSVLPLGPSVQFTSENLDGPIDLRVYPGESGSFTMFEDSGDGFGFEHDEYAEIVFSYDAKESTLVIGDRKGKFAGMVEKRVFNIYVVREGHGVGIDSTTAPDSTHAYIGEKLTIPIKSEVALL